MTRLVLIDGNAILHRAYHALPPLTTPDGKPVNAVYGFVSMLLKLCKDLAPTHLAVAFDRPAPTFREKLYKEYQAQRPKMEEELAGQIEKVHEVIAAFGIPIYEIDGFEADDVIGTLSRQISNPKHQIPNKSQAPNSRDQNISQIIIVTGDRDLLQLVNETTYVYMPTKGLSEAKLYDAAAVKEKMGVLPQQIPDFKALAGDASDNYPGVLGIGPKTAAALLAQFDSMEALYKAGRKLPETVMTKLAQGKHSAELGKQLATVRTDVPIELNLEKASLATLDTPQARKTLEDLHFPSLLKRLGGSDKTAQKSQPHSSKTREHESKRQAGEQQPLF